MQQFPDPDLVQLLQIEVKQDGLQLRIPELADNFPACDFRLIIRSTSASICFSISASRTRTRT